MINLYIINESSISAVYGIGTYIRELTAALKNSEIKVCVIHLFTNRQDIETEEEVDGVNYWYIPAPNNSNLLFDKNRQRELYYRNVLYFLRLQVKETDRPVFHLNNNLCAVLAEELKRTFDCRIVATVHYVDWGLYINDNIQRLHSMLNEEYPGSFGKKIQKSFEEEKLYFSKVDKIICPSNYMHKILSNEYGLDSTKISFIPNGLTDMSKPKTSIQLLRRKWNVSSKEKIVLFVGRIDEVKGTTYLIRAFCKVLQSYPGCRLVIAGNGNYNMCLQESKGIYTKITFTGLIKKEELNELYHLSCIGVVPSLFETFGYVAMEMMMHGLPIVVTATSGLKEALDDSCALKVPLTLLPDNVEIDTILLAEKIKFLLKHPAKAKCLAKNARKSYKIFTIKRQLSCS